MLKIILYRSKRIVPKKELPRKIIKQEMMWPTPYWHTHDMGVYEK